MTKEILNFKEALEYTGFSKLPIQIDEWTEISMFQTWWKIIIFSPFRH